jgi:hypothetical protein
MDSSDFCKKEKKSVHKKRHQWSHKLKGPGRRWLTICNTRGQTQWVFTPHQPTNYDGNLTLIYFFMIEKFFSHTTIIIDNHFRKAAPFFTTITLITPVSKVGHPRIVNKKKVLNELSHKDEHINEVIAGVRGKVENFYDRVKQYFLALSKPFYEDKKQHDYVVKVAFACHRLILN